MFSAILRPGVELRLPEERIVAALYKVIDIEREHLREWLAWVSDRTCEDDILAWVRAVLEQFASNKGFSAVIWVDGRIAGVVGIHGVNWQHRKAEIGYWLAREYQGQGIVTDACRAIVHHLLIELNLHRVEIQCAPGNARSKAVPKRLGFTHEGTLRDAQMVDGRYIDLEVHSMLRGEWERQAR